MLAKLNKYQKWGLGILLLIIIFASLCSCGVVPYVKTPNYSKFEPFEGLDSKSSLVGNGSSLTGDAILKPELKTEKSNDSVKKDENKKEGFINFSPFSIHDNYQTIDVFSNLKSDPNCKDTGYTKNGGFVCLDDETRQKIMNRGM